MYRSGRSCPVRLLLRHPVAHRKKSVLSLAFSGRIFCEKGYYVKRESFNSLLLLYLLDGECTLRYGGKVYRAQKGDMMFVNCYQPHEYFTDTHMHCLWMHFDGCQSLRFWETVTKSRGMVDYCHHPEPYLEMMDILLHIFRTDQTLSEPTISVLLHKVLCSMIAAITADGTLQLDEGPVAWAARYISWSTTTGASRWRSWRRWRC